MGYMEDVCRIFRGIFKEDVGFKLPVNDFRRDLGI